MCILCMGSVCTNVGLCQPVIYSYFSTLQYFIALGIGAAIGITYKARDKIKNFFRGLRR
ncbi:TPA: hypothetical protein HA239_03710 [Candidatus Woesearchaeota archaeon]|nr:hypothetical protein QT06_C0001G0841 [archaeon GW2011_AR15]MBS3103380.1 hypothetical protein [Candidatus Woesearchaeota archaeon]HIH41497.1 hypothetical protein [Candidatus Woesearchaeota archaeon]